LPKIPSNNQKIGEIIIENSTEAGMIYYNSKLKKIKILLIFNDDSYEVYVKSDFIKILEFVISKINNNEIILIVPTFEKIID
jgi:hypothetical protein